MSTLFSTGLSGLNVARTALVTTAHNTANVYTEGYSRQRVLISANQALATGAGYVGTGARVDSVQRSYDSFLSTQLSQADSAAQGLDTYSTQISRLDNMLADSTSGLSAMMQSFFAGVQAVADTPADAAARQQMLSKAEALGGKFRSMDGFLTQLDGSVNEQIDGSVLQINSIASQIASLNTQISQLSASSGGQPPNDLLDTRDQLVSDLSKLVGVTVVQQEGGQYNLFVGSGHTLVLGNRASTMTSVVSSADPTRRAVAMATSSGAVVELDDSGVTGGSLGGILGFRDQALAATRNAIGRIAVVLGSAFNEQHRLGKDLLGADGGDFFTAGALQPFADTRNNGTMAVSATIADAAALTGNDYRITVSTGALGQQFRVTRAADGQPVPVVPAGATVGAFGAFPISFDGLTLSAAGAAQDGDSFLVQPTRTAARDFAVAITDPAKIAAGTVAPGVSDGRNALELAGLQRMPLVGGTATLNGAYARLVSEVGNRTMEVQVAYASQASLAAQVRTTQQSFSGVNQDEETANLLMFQQMYQANAKVIQAASAIFDTILGLR